MEATLGFTVTDADTAAAVGSGSLPVLAASPSVASPYVSRATPRSRR